MSAPQVVVGLDIGTSSSKALVVSTDGAEVADARVASTWTERAGWSETTGDALLASGLAAVVDALEAAARTLGAAPRVLGLGICGMGECGVLLRPDGTPAAPVIAWFDPRGTAEMAALPGDVREAFPGATGLPGSALSTLAKLLWLRGQGVLAGPGHCWLNVPEYVAHRLGGERASEPSLASRTGLVQQSTASPWAPALELLGAVADLLPPTRVAGTSLGAVSAVAVSAALSAGPAGGPSTEVLAGLVGAQVVVAGHDHPVASFGAGAWGPEDLFDSCGTAESVLRVVSRRLTDAQRATLVRGGLTAGSHVLADRWIVAGPTRGGIVMGRVLRLLGCGQGEAQERLDAGWAPEADPPRAVVSGAGMDEDEVLVRALADEVGPADVWAATLSHVSGTVAALARSIDEQVGSRRQRVVAAGGWTRMASVRAQKARSLPDVTFSPRSQPGAYGAAVLAAWAAAGGHGSAVAFAEGFVARTAPNPRTPHPVVTEGANA